MATLIAEPASSVLNQISSTAGSGGQFNGNGTGYRMVGCLWVPYGGEVASITYGVSFFNGSGMSWALYQYPDGELMIPGQPVPQLAHTDPDTGSPTGSRYNTLQPTYPNTLPVVIKPGFLWVLHSMNSGTSLRLISWVPQNDTSDENMFLGGAVANGLPPTFGRLSGDSGLPATLDLTNLTPADGRGFPIVRFA